MNSFNEMIEYLDNFIGQDTEQEISLATISISEDSIKPNVRMVCSYYEDGTFYISTDKTKMKMIEIEKNPNVAICSYKWFTFSGVASNLGWVKKDENKPILEKFHKIFGWFEAVGDENNENSIVLAVKIQDGKLIIHDENGGQTIYNIDLVNKTINKKVIT